MNKVLWSCAVLLAVFVTVESLECYTCDLEFFSACFKTGKTNCSTDQNRCFKAVAVLSNELLNIHERGCIDERACVNSTGSVLNVNYTITRHCCQGDLCNGATSVQLPLITALCAALVALWSQWSL